MNPFTYWIAHADIFDWMTNITAFISVGVLLLVVYGFRRYTIRPRTDPIDYIGTGIWLLALTKAVRLVWWDLLPDFFEQKMPFNLDGSDVNWAFNALVIFGSWYMLKGFYMLVELQAPGQYSILTAVFYPRRIRLSFVNRPKAAQKEQEK